MKQFVMDFAVIFASACLGAITWRIGNGEAGWLPSPLAILAAVFIALCFAMLFHLGRTRWPK